MFSTKKHCCQHGSATSWLIVSLAIIVAGLLLFYRQYAIDQLSVWQYQPTSDVVALAKRAGFNGNGTFHFYASHPEIDDASTFNKHCSKQESSTAILGCYNGQNIFIYNVTNPKLDGIREVTAAHEMLHVAYARLSNDEKTRLSALLAAEYTKLKNNQEFAERMSFYDRTEPGERDNELHSIIGTEVASISPELETYYQKYFADRTKVVAMHQNYATVFADLQKRSDEISAQLNQLSAAVRAQSEEYNSSVAQLNQDIATFNARAKGGGFTSDAQFQAERSVLTERARQLETKRQTINGLISQYNALRDELAAVASESDALNQSIDSSLAPSPSLQ